MIPLPVTVEVTATQPGGSPITLYRTAAGPTTGPTPLGTIEVAWSRPSPRDHSDASEVTITIAQPATAPIMAVPYDTELLVTVTYEFFRSNLTRCWVTGWERHVDDAGIAWYTITAEDVVGRAEGTMIGSTPWPSEATSTRAARINSASPAPLVDITTGWASQWVQSRDVDNLSVLDLTRRSLWIIYQLHSSIWGLRGQANGGYMMGWNGVIPSRLDGTSGVVSIPTAAVVDNGHAMTRAHRVTHVAVSAKASDVDQEATTITFRASPLRGPTSQHKIDTDCLFSPGSPVDDMLRGWISESAQPIVLLLPSSLNVHLLTPAQLYELLDMGTRVTTCLYLDGPLAVEAPRVQFITAGRVVVQGGQLLSYDVALTPGAVAGKREYTWRDIANDSATYRFRPWSTPRTGEPRTTFRHTRTMTIFKEI